MNSPKPRYDVQRLVDDMGARGWNATRLALEAGVVATTVSNFLNGRQTAKTAGRLARALGFSPRRYLIRHGSRVQRVA